MALKTIYRTIIEVEVLSDKPICNQSISLSDLAYETIEGGWSASLNTTIADEPVSGLRAVELTKAQGSDPEFFFMDKEGNDMNEEDQEEEP